MNMHDPNLAAVELVAAALGPLCSELVLVGGCSVGLLITDQARPPVRQTIDVDLVAQVASVGDYYGNLHPKLKARGFVESADAEHFCRWTKGSLIVDVMPSKDILGHSTNVWYEAVVQQATAVTLGSGQQIQLVSAPLFIATKLESFHGRAGGDYLHHDMEDIINVVDGRPELGDEVRTSDGFIRDFIEDEIDALLADATFVDQLPGHFSGDAASQARVPVVVQRLRSLAGI
jgi:predicted nucleotidyltransferase